MEAGLPKSGRDVVPLGKRVKRSGQSRVEGELKERIVRVCEAANGKRVAVSASFLIEPGRSPNQNSLLMPRRQLDPIFIIVLASATLYPQALTSIVVARGRRHGRLVFILQLRLEVGNLAVGSSKLGHDGVLIAFWSSCAVGSTRSRRNAIHLLIDRRVRDRGGGTQGHGGRDETPRISSCWTSLPRRLARKLDGIVTTRIEQLSRAASGRRRCSCERSSRVVLPPPPNLLPPTSPRSPILGAPAPWSPTRPALLTFQTLATVLLRRSPAEVDQVDHLTLAPRSTDRTILSQLALPRASFPSSSSGIRVEQATGVAAAGSSASRRGRCSGGSSGTTIKLCIVPSVIGTIRTFDGLTRVVVVVVVIVSRAGPFTMLPRRISVAR